MNRRQFITATAATGAAALAGCSSSEEESPSDAEESTTTNNTDEQDAIEIVEHEGTEDEFGALEVKGEIENTGDSPVDYVEVETLVYDADGTRVDEYTDIITDLRAGERATFRAILTVEASEAEEYEVTAYV